MKGQETKTFLQVMSNMKTDLEALMRGLEGLRKEDFARRTSQGGLRKEDFPEQIYLKPEIASVLSPRQSLRSLRIFNIRWPEKIRNEELWERAGQEPLAKQILRRKHWKRALVS
nr:hypothetical protein BaRGS_018061 [Batillaria attramentaria]